MQDQLHGIFGLPPLERLILWRDPVARTAAGAMAADEALLNHGDASVLRIYHWRGPSVTYGYFDTEAEAREYFDDNATEYIRRWTGGGIVDHRHDTPYTLILKTQDRRGRPTSASLYRWIHGALLRTLRHQGVNAVMLGADAPGGDRSCFSSPVTSDLVLADGSKLAGAGQRRSRRGVMHQGSIQNCELPQDWDYDFARRLAEKVVISHDCEPFEGFQTMVDELAARKYSTREWALERRCADGHRG